MGAAISSNVTNLTTNLVTNSLSDVLKSEINNINSSQILTIQNVSGNVTVEGNKFGIKVDVNMKSLADSLNDSDVRQSLEEQIAQSAKALIKDLNLGNISAATNDIENYINDTINITTRLSDVCTNNISTTQSFTIDQVQGDVVFKDNDVRASIKSLTDCVQKAVARSSAVNNLQQMYSQTAISESKGISIWGIFSIVACVVGAIIFSVAAPAVVPAIIGSKYPIIFGVFFILLGIGFVLLWNFWGRDDIKTTMWSKLFKYSCGNYTPVETTAVNNADEAKNICLNKNYKSFDFVSYELDTANASYTILDKPYALFYDRFDKYCVPKQDNFPVLDKRAVYVTDKTYSNIEKPIANRFLSYGSISINVDKCTYQEFLTTWSQEKVLYNIVQEDKDAWNKVTSTYNWANKSKLVRVNLPNLNVINNGDTTAPFVLEGDDNLYNMNLNVMIGSSVYKTFQLIGPGKIPTTTILPNTSGYRYKTRKTWAIYLGIGLILSGLLILLILGKKKLNKKKTEKKNEKPRAEYNKESSPSVFDSPRAEYNKESSPSVFDSPRAEYNKESSPSVFGSPRAEYNKESAKESSPSVFDSPRAEYNKESNYESFPAIDET